MLTALSLVTDELDHETSSTTVLLQWLKIEVVSQW